MTRSALPDRRWALAVLLIAFAASAVRLAAADHSLWFDELASLWFAGKPVAQLWSAWIVRKTNPPLYYTMLRGWIGLAGAGDVAVRVPSILAGALAIGLSARLGARLYGPRAGLIAALLAAVAGQHLFYALQARGYIFAYCATTIAIEALFVTARDLGAERPSWRILGVYLLAAAVAIYLHTTLLLLPVIGVPTVVVMRFDVVRARPATLVPLVAANLALLLVASWWIWVTVQQVGGDGANIAANLTLTPHYFVQRTGVLFLARGNGEAGTSGYAVMALVAAIAIWFAWADRSRFATRFLAMFLLLTIALFGAIGIKVPIYTSRTLFWVSLIPLLFTAGALARVADARWRGVATAAVLALLAANTAVAIRLIEPEDWNGAIRTAAARPGSILLVASEAMGVNAAVACARLYPRCPVSIVAMIDPDDRADSWAAGQFAGPRIAPAAVPRLPADRPIFLFRKEAYHNVLDELHTRGLARRVQGTAALQGPFHAADLR